MSGTNRDTHGMETKIALLERDYSRIVDLLERLDTSIVKLTDVSASLKEMLAVQESRIDNQDSKTQVLERRLDKCSDRIEALENWRWYLTGAVALGMIVIPYIITHVLRTS